MPKPYLTELGDDVVRVGRNREPGVTISQILKGFGVHPMTLQKWLCGADIDEGAKPGHTRVEAAELRQAHKRSRLLEQQNEMLRLAAVFVAGEPAGKGFYPLVRELSVDGIPVTVACRVPGLSPAQLPVAGRPHHFKRGGAGLSRQRAVRLPPRRPRGRVPAVRRPGA